MTTPTRPAQDAEPAREPASLARAAAFALFVLFSMNLLNYADRYAFAAVGPGIMRDLDLNKERFGLLSSSFMIVYTLVAPAMGWLGDRYDRRRLLAFGVGLWSVATVGSAFARSFEQMFMARALLGVGEASYGVVAPTLLADFFDVKKRGRVMGIFYLALPVGTAVGYGVGGLMEHIGNDYADAIISTANNLGLGRIADSLVQWRLAFWVVGVPGLALAIMGLVMRDPGRGASDLNRKDKPPPLPELETEAPDHVKPETEAAAADLAWSEPGPEKGHPGKPTLADYLGLLKTPSYMLNTLGMAAVTFTTGAFGNWFPTYFEQVHHTQPKDKIWLGLALAGAGLVGVLIGMWIPDRLQQRTRRAYLLWPAFAVLMAVPIGGFGLLAHDRFMSLGLLTLASIFMASCLGPCNTVTANVVPGNRRAVGYAFSIFLLHLFGDIPSPPLIGWVADYLGTKTGRASALGRMVEGMGAMPIIDPKHSSNLTAGMLLIVPVLLLGCVFFFFGARFLPDDQAKAQAEGGGEDGGFVGGH